MSHRIETAQEILYAYGVGPDDEENLVEVLRSLLVWAKQNAVDFNWALGEAAQRRRAR